MIISTLNRHLKWQTQWRLGCKDRPLNSLECDFVPELNTRAKGLLVGEYPQAERNLHREDGKWVQKI